MSPELWIVAGPNGAGKATLASREPIASLIHSIAEGISGQVSIHHPIAIPELTAALQQITPA
jgi:predicted ABC-type ATPase